MIVATSLALFFAPVFYMAVLWLAGRGRGKAELTEGDDPI